MKTVVFLIGTVLFLSAMAQATPSPKSKGWTVTCRLWLDGNPEPKSITSPGIVQGSEKWLDRFVIDSDFTIETERGAGCAMQCWVERHIRLITPNGTFQTEKYAGNEDEMRDYFPTITGSIKGREIKAQCHLHEKAE